MGKPDKAPFKGTETAPHDVEAGHSQAASTARTKTEVFATPTGTQSSGRDD
jgi:hypothetical protein